MMSQYVSKSLQDVKVFRKYLGKYLKTYGLTEERKEGKEAGGVLLMPSGSSSEAEETSHHASSAEGIFEG